MSKSNDKRTYFETQRDLLLGKISTNMEGVLSNLNTLNRSLEGIVAVGKEFEGVSQLWENFNGGLMRTGGRDQEEEEEDEEEDDIATGLGTRADHAGLSDSS